MCGITKMQFDNAQVLYILDFEFKKYLFYENFINTAFKS